MLSLIVSYYWLLLIALSQPQVIVKNTTDVILLTTKEFVSNTTHDDDSGCSMCTYIDSFNANESYHFLSESIGVINTDLQQIVSNIYDNNFNQYSQSNNPISNNLPFLSDIGYPNTLNFETCTSSVTNDIMLCLSLRAQYAGNNFFECYILFNKDSVWSHRINITIYPYDGPGPTTVSYINLLCLENGNYLLMTYDNDFFGQSEPFYYNLLDKNGNFIVNNQNTAIRWGEYQMKCFVLTMSSFDTSFMLFCGSQYYSTNTNTNNCTMNYIKGIYNLNNNDIYFEPRVYPSNIESFHNHSGDCLHLIGYYPTSINITNSCCYFVPFIRSWPGNSSVWFTINNVNGTNIMNDVLVGYQQKENDVFHQVNVIDLTMINSVEYYYFMVIYSVRHVISYNVTSSIIGIIYNLDFNGNLKRLNEITFVDSRNGNAIQDVNDFCVNILNKKDNVISLTWTSYNKSTLFEYIYGQSWQIQLD